MTRIKKAIVKKSTYQNKDLSNFKNESLNFPASKTKSNRKFVVSTRVYLENAKTHASLKNKTQINF